MSQLFDSACLSVVDYGMRIVGAMLLARRVEIERELRQFPVYRTPLLDTDGWGHKPVISLERCSFGEHIRTRIHTSKWFKSMLGWWIGRLSAIYAHSSQHLYIHDDMTHVARPLPLSFSVYYTLYILIWIPNVITSCSNISHSSALLHLPLQAHGNCCLDYEEQCGRKTCELCGSPLSIFQERWRHFASDCAVPSIA